VLREGISPPEDAVRRPPVETISRFGRETKGCTLPIVRSTGRGVDMAKKQVKGKKKK
jgi:hypothetical protein